MYKMAIITSFLGGVKNRFMNYQEERSIEEKIRLASRVEGLSGLELCYPADFQDREALKAALDGSGLGISAVNFRSRRSGTWWRGSLSSADRKERGDVVDDLRRAMDAARETGCSMVSTCPLNEGSDYLFEIDYGDAYRYLEESLRRAGEHDPEVRIAVEYKTSDPRTQGLLGTAGETLLLCRRIGLPNIGVTLDFGHSIYAGERPAQAAALTALEGRLFYVHLNDNDRRWDLDLVPGAFNFWDTLEFLFFIKKAGYSGWIAFDVFSKEIDVVKTFGVVVKTTEGLVKLTDRIDPEKAREIFEKRDPMDSLRWMYSLVDGRGDK